MTERRMSYEEIKRYMERKQDEEVAKTETYTHEQKKRKLLAEQDEKLAKQELHDSSSLEVSDGEIIKIFKVKKLDDFKIGFYGETKPCDGFIGLHGEKRAKDTDIYLTFSHYETLYNNNVIRDEKPSKIVKNYCLGCVREILKNWLGVLIDDFYIRQKRKLDENIEKDKKDYH